MDIKWYKSYHRERFKTRKFEQYDQWNQIFDFKSRSKKKSFEEDISEDINELENETKCQDDAIYQ